MEVTRVQGSVCGGRLRSPLLFTFLHSPQPFSHSPTPSPPPPPMERRPPEPKRSGKDAIMDSGGGGGGGDEDEDDIASASAAAGDDKRRRPSLPLASGARKLSPGAGGGTSSPCCQAECCAADLSDAKRYHRRHKVCEAHSKAPVVVVAGLRQRFCQQCSRFHELSEFDDTKRSCRRRLAGHNERRRKSAAEPEGEGSSRCRGADQGGRVQIGLSGNTAFKDYHIR